MRKRYLIDSGYQVKLILEIAALVVAATLVSAIATFVLANRELADAFYLAHRDTWDVKRMLLPVIVVTSAVTFVVFTALSVYLTLRITHRVVGPRERLTRAMRDIARGRIVHLGAFRKGDVLKGLDESVNQLAEGLSGLEGELARCADDLWKEVEALDPATVGPERVERLKAKVHDLEMALGFFSRDQRGD